MKNYPLVLADANVLSDVLEYLYTRAENLTCEVETYKARLEEDPCSEYYSDIISEYSVKATAYVRLAEKLSK